MASLLLYSLAEFREIIFEAFAVAGVRRVMEVGSEAGGFTEHLTDWVHEQDGILCCIDPKPSEAVRQLAESTSRVELYEMTSFQALGEMSPADAYLLDGDHNYVTVTGELERIEKSRRPGTRHPLILAADVDWPWGRRDLYYDPSALPTEAVHPYSYDLGVVPSSRSVDRHGFRSHTEFAVALEEGGPANGVRTAVEDFLAEHPHYLTLHLPCVFGLMFIFPADAPWADELIARFGVYDDNPLLERLERNRVDLYLKVLELQDDLDADRVRAVNRIADVEAQMQDLRTTLAMTRERLRDAEEALAAASAVHVASTAPAATGRDLPGVARRAKAGLSALRNAKPAQR